MEMPSPKKKQALVTLEYQPYFAPSTPPDELLAMAAQNDDKTMERFRPEWLSNIKENHARFGPFKDHSLAPILRKFENRPVICAGSGPSLRRNAHLLAKRSPTIGLVSCLHNFHYLEDIGANVDYYVSLDSQKLVISEMTDGGQRTPEEYWALTKDKTLICFIGSPPELIERWQGEVLFFNAPMPDEEFVKEVDALEMYTTLVSTGGTVLGACVYLAQIFMGARPVIFVGADFSFGYDEQFHPWKSDYDLKLGHVMKATDVFGMPVKTWPSYYGMKLFFEYMARHTGWFYINCTEGGILGSYPEGNVISIRSLDLDHTLAMYSVSDDIVMQALNPEKAPKKLVY